mmetsp:Transcript_12727/g.30322  ORF Transcript_12727/g.30322 Transcript_12727/m.30322 type:complete len:694 (-) Transcript_12727:117-2198(-)|eukprot:CAMPEP_0113621820 /NCGR_PEP_ID=MMETSP0017_2-20120614/11164_1 /TAXON_ID=2856 /ORGANISM="Cylindrotheca closterium" /LENGTH=693 /DNA_ID=CAMNT_0000531601 /DNA_START=128 /DNA_END=2209 /DNA_ORIENTATION=+ /assembly_acc=CAM_ASM_000147
MTALGMDEKKILQILENIEEAPSIRQSNEEFLNTLHAYLDCRTKMDAEYGSVDPSQQLANFQIESDSGGIEDDTMDDKNMYKYEYQQQSTEWEPVKDISELYTAAEMIRPVYIEKVESLVAKVKEIHGQESQIKIKIPPLKGKERAMAKAEDDYGNRDPGPAVSWLYDIVRGSVLFSSADCLLTCVRLIKEDDSIHIVKSKNRFANPTLTGYRDWNMQIKIEEPEEEFEHVCELQLHHESIKELSITTHSHLYYEFFRKYFAGATDSLTERLEDLKMIAGGDKLDGAFLNQLLEETGDVERLKRLANLFGDFLCEFQWTNKVYAKMLKQQLAQASPDDHFKLAMTMNNMANNFQQQGKLDDAYSMYEEVLKVNKTAFGEDHASVAVTLTNMANVKSRQGKSEEAMVLYEESLEMKQKNLGHDSSVAETLNNVGNSLHKQGRLDEAMTKYKEALEIYKSTLGEDSSSVAVTTSNMANVLKSKGDLDGAMAKYQEALEIYKRTLGMDHSSVAVTLNNMGNIMEEKSNLDDAMNLYEQALSIKKQTMGEEHSSVAATMNNIAAVLQKQNKLDEAMGIYVAVVEIYNKTVGEDHPNVAITVSNMANILKSQGKMDAAITRYQQALAIKKKAYGKEHSSVAITLNNMATLLEAQGRLEEALSSSRETLTIFQKTVGDAHPHTAMVKKRIARLESNIGK